MKIYKIAQSVIVYHGSNDAFEGFDSSKQMSGYYPGFYVSSSKEFSEDYGNINSFILKGNYYVVDDSVSGGNGTSDQLKQLARDAGYSVTMGSGNGECEYLKGKGYSGIQRGVTYVVFEPEKSLERV